MCHGPRCSYCCLELTQVRGTCSMLTLYAGQFPCGVLLVHRKIIRWRTTCQWIAPVALVEVPSVSGFPHVQTTRVACWFPIREGKGVLEVGNNKWATRKIWVFGARLFLFKICNTWFPCDRPEISCHCRSCSVGGLWLWRKYAQLVWVTYQVCVLCMYCTTFTYSFSHSHGSGKLR